MPDVRNLRKEDLKLLPFPRGLIATRQKYVACQAYNDFGDFCRSSRCYGHYNSSWRDDKDRMLKSVWTNQLEYAVVSSIPFVEC